MSEEISTERKNAIELARSFGWRVERDNKRWRFSQPDTGGVWDVFYISHQYLSVSAVLRKLENYEPELAEDVAKVRAAAQLKWLKKRRPQFFLSDKPCA